jgi:CheY-like chemotaxis protein
MGDIIYLAGRDQRPTILLVESETLLRAAIAASLRKCDFAVVEAVNGEEALTLLRSGRMAHAVLSALTLDGAVSGLELAEAVQREFPGLKLLLGASTEDAPRRQRFTIVERPYEPAAVEATIRALLSGRPSVADLDHL